MPDDRLLSRIRALLELPEQNWLETIRPMMQYRIQADDHDGDPNRFWLTVAVGNDGTAAIRMDETWGSPIQSGFEYCPGGANQRVRNALLILAEAIRLDAEEIEPKSMKDRSSSLKEVHKLLDNLPWLDFLSGDREFNATPGIGPGDLSVYFQEDTFLNLEFTEFRFRGWFGGGKHLHVVSALKILAVAMKLDSQSG